MPQSSPLQAVFQRRVVCRESLGSRVSPSIGSTSYNSGGAIRFSESRRTKKRRRCCTKEGIGAPRQVRTADLRFQVCVAFATPWTLSSPCPDALARSGRQADCRRVSTHAHPDPLRGRDCLARRSLAARCGRAFTEFGCLHPTGFPAGALFHQGNRCSVQLSYRGPISATLPHLRVPDNTFNRAPDGLLQFCCRKNRLHVPARSCMCILKLAQGRDRVTTCSYVHSGATS